MRLLSPHFSIEEFTASDTAEAIGDANEPTTEHLQHLKELADFMERVRALFGRAIVIFSGYRNPVVNRAVGGVPNSDHALGYACDFRVAGMTPLAVARAIAASELHYDQCILEGGRGVVHIGINPRGRRQNLSQPGGPGSPVHVLE